METISTMPSDKYSRQELFTPIGKEGQARLKEKHVLIIGAGALGSSNSEILVRAGVGKVTIVDRDYVEYSNLQRQQLYCENDADQRLPKVVAAEQRLKAINSEVEIVALVMDVSIDELEELVVGVDVIVDSTDNFETRLMINDISQKYNVPWVFGACVGSYGLSYTFIPGETPCFNCLLESILLQGMTCDTVGVIAPAITMVVSYQTTEVLKLLVGDKESLRQTLVTFDLWRNQHTAIKVGKAKKESCLSCGEERTYPYLSQENATKTAVLCGRETVQLRPPKGMQVDLEHLVLALQGSGNKVERNPYLLSTEIDGYRVVIFQDGRVLVHGTKDVTVAKAIYQRLIG